MVRAGETDLQPPQLSLEATPDLDPSDWEFWQQSIHSIRGLCEKDFREPTAIAMASNLLAMSSDDLHPNSEFWVILDFAESSTPVGSGLSR